MRAVPISLTKKFVYSHVNPEGKQASIKQAVSLLSKARLCHPVYSTYANGVPLGADMIEKMFKLIFIDVGLVSTMLGIKLYEFEQVRDILAINQGALAEQMVGQLLRLLSPSYVDPALYYWSRPSKSSSAEIDYILQHNQYLVPIEVKAGSEGKMRSLHQFMYEKSWKIAVRFYAGPLLCQKIKTKTTQGHSVEYQLISLPFYLIGQLHRFIEAETTCCSA